MEPKFERSSSSESVNDLNNVNVLPLKNIYEEHPSVAAMSIYDARDWRLRGDDLLCYTNNGYPQPDIPNPVLEFDKIFMKYPIIMERLVENFRAPTKLQSQAWPVLLQGWDTLITSQTGTGKSLAFLLPALIHVYAQPTTRSYRPGPTALILVSTDEEARELDKTVNEYKGSASVATVYTHRRLRSYNPDILITKPDVLRKLIKSKRLDVSTISYAVLDKIDKMIKGGHEMVLKKCLTNLRPGRQMIMTSTTWSKNVIRLQYDMLINNMHLSLGPMDDDLAIEVYYETIVVYEREDKYPHLEGIIQTMRSCEKAIIFCTTAWQTILVFEKLSKFKKDIGHINDETSEEDVEKIIKDVIRGKIQVLVTTDEPINGKALDNFDYVINYSYPGISTFKERITRTGDSSSYGCVITYMIAYMSAYADELSRYLDDFNYEVPPELDKAAERYRLYGHNYSPIEPMWM